jgi:hypothetical protein
MNAKVSHLIAVALLSAGQILQFLNTNPAIAQQMHVTSTILTIAGFLVALASQQLFGSATPPPQAPLASTTSTRGFVDLRTLAVASAALIMAGIAACTAQQAQNGVNAVFTADQAACIVLNSGIAGDSNAVQEFEETCSIAPQFEAAIQALIADLTTNPATAAKVKAAGLRSSP